MWKKFWKQYWKSFAAAAFLAVAGICYGCAGGSGNAGNSVPGDGMVRLAGDGFLESDEVGAGGAEVPGSDAAAGAGNVPGSGDAGAPGAAGGSGAEPVTEAPGCFVHICGEVKSPGVYELSEGSRVFEAVEAAGGFTDEAEENLLNLAEKIADGMKIEVLSKEEAKALTEEERQRMSGTRMGQGSGASTGGQAGQTSGAGSSLINLNTASKEALMTLSGIGESRAEDIIRYREENGGFKKIEDIMKVPGIKNAGFQKIKDNITV